MATHFHYCEQCGFQYPCTAVLAQDDERPGPLCAVTAARVCDTCAATPSTAATYADYYEALRAADEARGDHIAASSTLGRDMARRVRTRREW